MARFKLLHGTQNNCVITGGYSLLGLAAEAGNTITDIRRSDGIDMPIEIRKFIDILAREVHGQITLRQTKDMNSKTLGL